MNLHDMKIPAPDEFSSRGNSKAVFVERLVMFTKAMEAVKRTVIVCMDEEDEINVSSIEAEFDE